ncbi:MAG: aminopeptidase [Candidatus Omnitrophota bacterium]
MNLNPLTKKIFLTCLGYKKGEHILIICDDEIEGLARDFYKAARSLNAKAILMRMPIGHLHGEEPPKEISAALKVTDIALLLTKMSLSHTRARKEASAKYGVRIASLPGVTRAMLARSADINYPGLKRKGAELARRLTKGRTVEVRTDKGTRLSFSIQGRKGFSDDGVYTKRGAFGNLPAGEACIAPREGTANGCLVVDATAPLVGRIRRPLKIDIKDGLIQNMPIAAIAKLIKPLGKCGRNIAEFGIGLNPKAKVTGNILEDEKVINTAHLAIGANISYGGSISCPCHLDFVFFKPRIYIDGKILFL